MGKDWAGNKASVRATLGVVQIGNTADRETNDFYATHPIAVELLLQHYELPYCIWECACGAGHIAKVLQEAGHYVYATDLINRGYGTADVDFLATETVPDWCKCILTNPPYKYTTEFVLHSLELLPTGGICCMLLNISYLSGITRYQKIYSKYPPKMIFVFTGRVHCAKNGDFKQFGDSAINYGWFIWEKDYIGETVIKWIDINDTRRK